ncbi:hypothetical protein JNK62_04145 [bacterium]|nr:hypothetical protein [bacterium]
MNNLLEGARDVAIGLVVYATGVFLVILIGQFLTPKGVLSMAPVYTWLAYISRPDILVTMIGAGIAVKYASQLSWAHSSEPNRRK